MYIKSQKAKTVPGMVSRASTYCSFFIFLFSVATFSSCTGTKDDDLVDKISRTDLCTGDAPTNDISSCNDILKEKHTIHVKDMKTLITAIDDFRKSYEKNITSADASAALGIDIPIDGIPVPFDFSGSGSYDKEKIKETLAPYQSLYHLDLNKEQDIAFYDHAQIEAWSECRRESTSGPKLLKDYEIKGNKILFSISMSSTYKSTEIQECVYSNSNDIIKVEKDSKGNKLDILESGETRAFSFAIDTLKPFVFRLVTNCYEPVTIYVPAKPELSNKVDYAADRVIELINVSPVLEGVGMPAEPKFQIKVTDRFGKPLRGQTIYVKDFVDDAKNYKNEFHFSANVYSTNEEGIATAIYNIPERVGFSAWTTLSFSLRQDFESSQTAKITFTVSRTQ